MMRWAALPIVLLPFVGGTLQAACLPTLGTEDCPRMWVPEVQAMAHKYFDTPPYDRHPRRGESNRHQRIDK
jgi:hypothetical protein